MILFWWVIGFVFWGLQYPATSDVLIRTFSELVSLSPLGSDLEEPLSMAKNSHNLECFGRSENRFIYLILLD